jgi:hypothetical protein
LKEIKEEKKLNLNFLKKIIKMILF